MPMDRRRFLQLVVGGVAAATAAREWPFRVYSFASDVVVAKRVEDIRHWAHVTPFVAPPWERRGRFHSGYAGLRAAGRGPTYDGDSRAMALPPDPRTQIILTDA